MGVYWLFLCIMFLIIKKLGVCNLAFKLPQLYTIMTSAEIKLLRDEIATFCANASNLIGNDSGQTELKKLLDMDVSTEQGIANGIKGKTIQLALDFSNTTKDLAKDVWSKPKPQADGTYREPTKFDKAILRGIKAQYEDVSFEMSLQGKDIVSIMDASKLGTIPVEIHFSLRQGDTDKNTGRTPYWSTFKLATKANKTTTTKTAAAANMNV